MRDEVKSRIIISRVSVYTNEGEEAETCEIWAVFPERWGRADCSIRNAVAIDFMRRGLQ